MKAPKAPDAPDPLGTVSGQTRRVIVSLHAHPDDEALLTAGTLACLAAEGHRVILLMATDGGSGLAASTLTDDLARRRRRELERSAAALGVGEVRWLGYADSGMHGAIPPGALCAVTVDEVASRVTEMLREVGADVLTSYDENGGYGHRDHVMVHRVGRRAARQARTPVLLEATVDRTQLLRAARLVHWLPRVPADFHPSRLSGTYASRAALTHRVDIGAMVEPKREAMASHTSQATADDGVRTLALFLRLPRAVFRRAFRYEWFIEVGREPGRPLLTDVLATLR